MPSFHDNVAGWPDQISAVVMATRACKLGKRLVEPKILEHREHRRRAAARHSFHFGGQFRGGFRVEVSLASCDTRERRFLCGEGGAGLPLVGPSWAPRRVVAPDSAQVWQGYLHKARP